MDEMMAAAKADWKVALKAVMKVGKLVGTLADWLVEKLAGKLADWKVV